MTRAEQGCVSHSSEEMAQTKGQEYPGSLAFFFPHEISKSSKVLV